MAWWRWGRLADVAMLFVRCRGGISHHRGVHSRSVNRRGCLRALLLRLVGEWFWPMEGQGMTTPFDPDQKK